MSSKARVTPKLLKMESSSDYRKTENGGTSSSSVPANGDISGRVVFGTGEIEGKYSWPNLLFCYIVDQSKPCSYVMYFCRQAASVFSGVVK